MKRGLAEKISATVSFLLDSGKKTSPVRACPSFLYAILIIYWV
jgi:hypothetical protein